MKDTVRVDHVKTLITKRQVLAVRDHKSAVSAVEPETMARDLDRSRREIDASAACATACKLQQVSAHTATDFEQLRAAKLIEAHQSRHPCSVLEVAIALYFVKKFARAEFVFAIVFGAARIVAPLLARTQFFFS